jgi:glutathione S-transferase
MITLYHATPTRSHLVRFVLEELGVPYEMRRVDIHRGEHKSPDYLATVNPMGQLPALRDGDTVICESLACSLHLADKAGKLAPAPGTPERARYYHWATFAIATQLIQLSKIAMHSRFLPEPARVAAIEAEGRRNWEQVAGVVSQAIKGKRWILGDDFTVADCLLGGTLFLANFVDVLAPHPELVAYYGRVSDRPAFQRAFAD